MFFIIQIMWLQIRGYANEFAKSMNNGWINVTKENLDYLYQINTDPELTIWLHPNIVGEVELTGKWTPGFNNKGENIRTVTARPISFNMWAVFGTLTLVNRPDGTYGIYDDTYNFEMHTSLNPAEMMRNLNTFFGSPSYGSKSGCTGFQIAFRGDYNPKNIILK